MQEWLQYISYDFITQALGVVALFIFLYGYIQKDDNKTIQLVLLSGFFWAGHFYMLELYTAFIAVLLSMMRIALSIKFKKNKYAFGFIVFAVIISGFFAYDGFLSLLPLLASLVGAYAYFYTEKKIFRSLLIVCSLLWFLQNIIAGSIPGIINETLAISITIFTLYRLGTFEGKLEYYKHKASDILHNRPKIDLGRFGVIRDYIKLKK